MLTIIVMFMSIMFFYTHHPLILSFVLMVFSVLCGFAMASSLASSWMSYMLIMVFLSGMMVILLYVASLSSNESVKINYKRASVSIFLISMVFIFFKEKKENYPKLNKMPDYWGDLDFEFIFKMYDKNLKEMTALLIIYLLVVLVSSVKILALTKGPLKMNK